MKNVYLVGMMGSGKTTTGKALAKMLGVRFVDLDEQIVERVGRSINDIFKMEGELYFRNVESELLLQVSKDSNQIVATGGGIVINPSNSARMKSTGLVVYLKTGLDALWQRVKAKTDRPLLSTSDPRKALEGLHSERTPLYEENSDQTFLTDGKSPEAVALEIYRKSFEGK